MENEEMSDSEMWKAHKEASQKKRWGNVESSLRLLDSLGIKYETLNNSVSHYRIAGISFWPTTGKYYNPKTGLKGRGVRNLIKELKHGK
jgi:hypothetical protein